MSFGDLYTVPPGGDVAPGLPPVELPSAGRPQRTRIEVVADRPKPSNDPAAAGFVPYAGPPGGEAGERAGERSGERGDPAAAGFMPYLAPDETPAKPSRAVSTTEATVRGGVTGLTMGGGPALAGLAEAGGPELPPKQDVATIDPMTGATANAGRPFVGALNMLQNAVAEHPDPKVWEAYHRGRKAALADEKLSQEQHPWAYLSGMLGGALIGPKFGAGRGVTTFGRVKSGAKAGAIGGGAFGTGTAISEGESLPDVVKSGAQGAGTGLVFGAVGATAADLVGKGVSKVASIVRGTREPDAEAGRRVVSALRKDFDRTGPTVDREAIAAGNVAGTPRAIVDVGSENTRALARSAANTSPDARAALQELTEDRFHTQSPRIAGFIRQLTGGGDAAGDLEALTAAARRANRPAYKRAYVAGDRGIWSPELERLAGSPAVVDAMRSAVARGKNRAINDGFGAFNPGVKVTEDGRLLFNQGRSGVPTYPNLQFFDYAQRELRDAANAAGRNGRTEEAATLNGLHRQLRDELDRLVPEFKAARATAATFFGAEDALEAGQRFVMMNAKLPEARRALAAMSNPERELFARGFASDLADKIEKTGDTRNVVNQIFGSESARQKIELALGPDRARELEALLRIETVVDQARRALGNSTTARQLAEAGLAGGGAVAAIEGIREHDYNPAHIIAAALTAGAARHGAKVIDERVARRVGEMLASNDPAILARGLKVVTRSPDYFAALLRATGAGARVGAHELGATGGLAAAGTALHSLVGGPGEHHKPDDPTYLQ